MGPVEIERVDDIEEAHKEALLGENDLYCDDMNDCWEDCSEIAREIRTGKLTWG